MADQQSTDSLAEQRSERNRKNRARWRGFTPEGFARLVASTRATQPWKYATGPRTPAGKARSAQNGRFRQTNEKSIRELRAELAEISSLMNEMSATRRSAAR